MNDAQASRAVSIVDVSPRDGLQNEKVPVSTQDKLRLINELIALGARRIEAVSFVNPRKVPQMADADAVMAGVPRDAGASFIGLVLNTKGAVRAVDAGVDEMNYVLPVTDAFAAANQNTTVAAALDALEEVSSIAAGASIPLTVTAAVAFGCPYQGDVPTEQTLAVVRSALQRGALAEIALADTIGCAVPWQVGDVFGELRSETGVQLRAHLHETRHTALANTYAAMAAGVGFLTARSEAWAASPLPRAPPATFPPRTWCGCWVARGSRPPSIRWPPRNSAAGSVPRSRLHLARGSRGRAVMRKLVDQSGHSGGRIRS